MGNENMSKTIADYPNLVLEWHPTKNGNLKPEDFTHGSNKKIWWKCSIVNNHEWEAQIISRTLQGSNCSYCSGKKVCSSNCLATLFPEIAREWHPIKNGDLTPYDVVAESNKKVWWICLAANDHEWKTSIQKRTNKNFKTKCPCCAGQKVVKSNCLSTTHPKIAHQWHPTKNGNLTPFGVIAGSNKKIWWFCDKGHEWEAACKKIALRKQGCPYCANRKVCLDNCLAITHPELTKEWHSIKNKLTPFDVTFGSRKEIWWRCKKGHEWKTIIKERTCGKKTNCPVCNESKGERKIRSLLIENKITFKPQYKIKNCKYKNSLSFDFGVIINNKLKLIEFNGKQHYESLSFFESNNSQNKFKLQKKRDKIKFNYCKKNNIPLLVIPYWEMDNIEKLIKEFLKI